MPHASGSLRPIAWAWVSKCVRRSLLRPGVLARWAHIPAKDLTSRHHELTRCGRRTRRSMARQDHSKL